MQSNLEAERAVLGVPRQQPDGCSSQGCGASGLRAYSAHTTHIRAARPKGAGPSLSWQMGTAHSDAVDIQTAWQGQAPCLLEQGECGLRDRCPSVCALSAGEGWGRGAGYWEQHCCAPGA